MDVTKVDPQTHCVTIEFHVRELDELTKILDDRSVGFSSMTSRLRIGIKSARSLLAPSTQSNSC